MVGTREVVRFTPLTVRKNMSHAAQRLAMSVVHLSKAQSMLRVTTQYLQPWSDKDIFVK